MSFYYISIIATKMKIKIDYFLLLFIALYSISQGLQIPYFQWVFCLIGFCIFFWVLYFKHVEMQLKVLLTLSFFDSEYFLFCLPLLILSKIILEQFSGKHVFKVNQTTLMVVILFMYVLSISIVVNFIDFSLFSLCLGIVVFFIILCPLIYFSYFQYTEDLINRVFLFFKKIILLQAVIVIVQFLKYSNFAIGDWGKGTTGGTDKMGLLFLLSILPFIILPLIEKKKKLLSLFSIKSLALGIIIVSIVYFLDIKATFFSIILGGIVFLFLVFLKIIINRVKDVPFYKMYLVVFFTLFFSIFIPFFANQYFSIVFKKNHYTLYNQLGRYIGKNEKTSQKFILYKHIYVDMFYDYPLVWTFGTGFGKLGGKASNSLAYDVLYKEHDAKKLPSFIPSYSSQWTKKYMTGLFTKDIADHIKWASSILSMPFAGMITLKAEFGLLGLLFWVSIFFYIAYRVFNKSRNFQYMHLRGLGAVLSIYCIAFLFLMVFDNWQETPQFILPFILFVAVFLSYNKNVIEHNHK